MKALSVLYISVLLRTVRLFPSRNPSCLSPAIVEVVAWETLDNLNKLLVCFGEGQEREGREHL